MKQENISPDRDASLGLIFRLNNLWAKADYYAENGDYDKWNWVLDRIYVNLQYRNSMVKFTDEKTGKVKYKVPMKDVKVYRYFSISLGNAKKKYTESRNRITKRKMRNKWYHLLMEKDMWLRKFMQELKLYLKETEKRIGTSVYGTFRGGG